MDGDLIELDPTVLARMRGDVVDVENGAPAIPWGADAAVAGRKLREWGEKCEAQTQLRDCIATWGGVWHYGAGEDDSTIQRRFYLTFGIDVL